MRPAITTSGTAFTAVATTGTPTHRLDDGTRPPLVQAREGEDIERRQQHPDVGALADQGEAAHETKPLDQALNPSMQRAVADPDRVHGQIRRIATARTRSSGAF